MKLRSLFALLLSASTLFAQDVPGAEALRAHNVFEGTRVVVGHSVELRRAGELDFLVAHKFGRVNGGIDQFFGLDEATMRLGFDYAPQHWINVGIGRSTLNKLVDGFVKVQVLHQQSGVRTVPLTAVLLSTAAVTTRRFLDAPEAIRFRHRLSYTHQVLLARQFSERISVQLMPTFTHYNLVDRRDLRNDVISIGGAGKYQLNKFIAAKVEYYYALPDQLDPSRTNSLAVGLDFDTGGHVFQLHLSNSGGLTEPEFIGNTTGSWSDGDIQIGFTISRVFRVRGRRY